MSDHKLTYRGMSVPSIHRTGPLHHWCNGVDAAMAAGERAEWTNVLDGSQAETIAYLERSLSEAVHGRAAALLDATDLRNDLEEACQELASVSWRQKAAGLSDALAQAIRQRDDALLDATDLRNVLANVRTDTVSWRQKAADLSDALESCRTLRAEHDALTAELDDARAERDTADARLEAAMSELEAVTIVKDNLQAGLMAACAHRDDAIGRLAEMTASRDSWRGLADHRGQRLVDLNQNPGLLA